MKMTKEKFLKIFIIIQPILDLITSYQSTYLNFDFSLSILIRGVSFILIIGYLLFFYKNNIVKRFILLVILFLMLFMTNMIFIKGYSYVLSEAYTVIRYFYFPIMLVFFYVSIKELKKNNLFDKKMIIYITSFYFLIVFLAFITKTSYLSYDDVDKIGFNGWFYSANERGSTYAIMLPILFTYIFKDKNIRLLILLGIFSMLVLGTKVGYLGVVLTLLSFLIYLVIKKIIKKGKNIIYISLTIIALGIIGFITPYLPVYKNINYQKDNVEEIINDKEDMTEEEIKDAIEKDDNYLIEDKNQNLIFSRREIFLKQNIDYYKEQRLMSKVFGLGSENKKLDGIKIASKVERDVFDIFFTFGIFGFIVYFLPIIYLLVITIKKILKNIKILFESNMWFYSTSIIMALLISFMSGHVLLAPSVSIYLVLIMCTLENDLVRKRK